MSHDLWDVVIVGGGAAGLSAALILAQARCGVLVVDGQEPRNRFDDHLHGYLGRDGMNPADLLAAGRAEVEGVGGTIRAGRVETVQAFGEEGMPRFRLSLSDGSEVLTRRLLVATGLRDELPDVEGLERWWGHEVFHCPYCHGVVIPEHALVGVLAAGKGSIDEAHLLLQWAERVVLLAHDVVEPTEEDLVGLRARDIEVVTGRVVATIAGGDDGERLVGVRLEDGTEVGLDELHVCPTVHPRHDLLEQLGVVVREEADERGIVVPTDDAGGTDVEGVWVAGNVRDTNAQVVDAAAQGLKAAVAINSSLTKELVQERRSAAEGIR
ncbi:NAD(P)/FAD-dependent oxidoreductase [Ornithinimicrobium panacihumi]|uniref:NAD(P)/FAD-dependent oxidoreductase n=1 Tax=Ornithinimicrobium panacihumi TaxID=2008449 RepID=UPI003F8B7A03